MWQLSRDFRFLILPSPLFWFKQTTVVAIVSKIIFHNLIDAIFSIDKKLHPNYKQMHFIIACQITDLCWKKCVYK